MDLGFPKIVSKGELPELPELPGDLAGIMAGIAARQAASPTAEAQARCDTELSDPRLLAPVHGAFNGRMASEIVRWGKP